MSLVLLVSLLVTDDKSIASCLRYYRTNWRIWCILWRLAETEMFLLRDALCIARLCCYNVSGCLDVCHTLNG